MAGKESLGFETNTLRALVRDAKQKRGQFGKYRIKQRQMNEQLGSYTNTSMDHLSFLCGPGRVTGRYATFLTTPVVRLDGVSPNPSLPSSRTVQAPLTSSVSLGTNKEAGREPPVRKRKVPGQHEILRSLPLARWVLAGVHTHPLILTPSLTSQTHFTGPGRQSLTFRAGEVPAAEKGAAPGLKGG